MFSRYGVNYLVQLQQVRTAAGSQRASEPGTTTQSATEEIAMFVRLGSVIAVVSLIIALAVWVSH